MLHILHLYQVEVPINRLISVVFEFVDDRSWQQRNDTKESGIGNSNFPRRMALAQDRHIIICYPPLQNHRGRSYLSAEAGVTRDSFGWKSHCGGLNFEFRAFSILIGGELEPLLSHCSLSTRCAWLDWLNIFERTRSLIKRVVSQGHAGLLGRRRFDYLMPTHAGRLSITQQEITTSEKSGAHASCSCDRAATDARSQEQVQQQHHCNTNRSLLITLYIYLQ